MYHSISTTKKMQCPRLSSQAKPPPFPAFAWRVASPRFLSFLAPHVHKQAKMVSQPLFPKQKILTRHASLDFWIAKAYKRSKTLRHSRPWPRGTSAYSQNSWSRTTSKSSAGFWKEKKASIQSHHLDKASSDSPVLIWYWLIVWIW